MSKTKISRLLYNTKLISNNKVILSKLIQSILEYIKLDIDISDKELLNKEYGYTIKLDEDLNLNIETFEFYHPDTINPDITYGIKICYEQFNSKDNIVDYDLLLINFNEFKNPFDKTVAKYYLVDSDDEMDDLSDNLCVLNVGVESCFDLVHNKTKLRDISCLERLAGMLYCEYLEDISKILGDDILTMDEKEKLLNDIELKLTDEEVQESLRFEDDIEHCFELVEEDALERGIKQGIEPKIINTIILMFQNNISIDVISKVVNKTMKEVEEIIRKYNNN